MTAQITYSFISAVSCPNRQREICVNTPTFNKSKLLQAMPAP